MDLIKCNSKPAILGGEMMFEKRLNLIRPDIPDWFTMQPHLKEIIDSTFLTKGPKLREFERLLEEYMDVRNVICVSSCTSGLMLLYKLLGLKGEVILPSFTFIATGSSLLWQDNLKPVFVDVDIDTFTIDIERVKKAITPKTSAVVGVHVYGNPANIEELEKISKDNDLKLIFDSAHGLGSKRKGKPIGGFGDAECFSCSPTKLLITGEGGIISTNNDDLAEKLRIAREYGNPGNYDCILPGMNARMSEFNAAMGIESLAILDDVIKKRNKFAAILTEHFTQIPGIKLQKIDKEDISSYKDYTLVIEEDFGLTRDQLSEALNAEGIETKNYYNPPIHMQTVFKDYKEEFLNKLPVTEMLANCAITLPLSSKFSVEEVEMLASAVERIYKFRKEINK